MANSPAPAHSVFQAMVDAGIEFSIYFAQQRGFDVSIAYAEAGVRNFQAGIATLPDCVTWLDERARSLFPDRNYVSPIP